MQPMIAAFRAKISRISGSSVAVMLVMEQDRDENVVLTAIMLRSSMNRTMRYHSPSLSSGGSLTTLAMRMPPSCQ